MRFSKLLSHLSEATDASPCHLAGDPEIGGAAALDQAGTGQLSFLEPGHALAAALAASGASAVLIPARGEEAETLQQQATDRGLAWVALGDPRLAFADVVPPMLDAAGQPRAELFVADRLHLSEAGYAVWQPIVAPLLR